jgi:hypothetical protein
MPSDTESAAPVDVNFLRKILAIMIFATVSCGTLATGIAVSASLSGPEVAVASGE